MHHDGRLHRNHAEPSIDVDGRRRTIALAVLCLCAFTTAIDITITNVALPFIGTELDASTSQLQWVIDAYTIALAGLLVLGGGMADRLGRRKIFLSGYAIFGLACVLAAFSPSVDALIGARVVMGIGAAGVIAPALAIVAALYPPDRRAAAIGAWAVFGAAGLAAGPVIGGLLLDQFWWGSVFLVNVPVVAVGVLVGMRTIPESRAPATGQPLDLLGALFSVLGLGALLFAIIEGPDRGWTSAVVLGALIAGVGLTVAFVMRELRCLAPLFDVRILSRSVVAAGAITLLAAYFVFNGMLFLLPQYLQDVQDEAIATVGLLLVPFAAVFGVLSTRAATVLQRLGARADGHARPRDQRRRQCAARDRSGSRPRVQHRRKRRRGRRAVVADRAGIDRRHERAPGGESGRWIVAQHGESLCRRRGGCGGGGLGAGIALCLATVGRGGLVVARVVTGRCRQGTGFDPGRARSRADAAESGAGNARDRGARRLRSRRDRGLRRARRARRVGGPLGLVGASPGPGGVIPP